MSSRLFFSLALAGLVRMQAGDAAHRDYFVPAHRLPGIGAGRAGLADDVIARRSARLIESQTFVILRDPRAVAGAQRIAGPKLQRLFNQAARASGVPSSLIAAMAYIESWGDSRARSPSGPRGIMQIAAGTARAMGLKIVYAKRYRTVTRIRRVRNRQGKRIARRVRVRVPYTVLVRDDRMVPARAIPAAAKYLARLSHKFGGLDWAVFAYHCGEGCATEMRSLTERAEGVRPPYTVAKMFFGGSPAFNRDLYLGVTRQMERDYSPTYWFRVARARQLLEMHREDPHGFRSLAAAFRYDAEPKRRAPHRLAVWLGDEPGLTICDGLECDDRASPEGVFDEPEYYGFSLRSGAQSSPAAVGTLAYIAYETRRLHEAMKVKGERFVPLDVASMGRPPGTRAAATIAACPEAHSHSTGHVFDIDYGNLPPGQREALEFVLDDMGWEGRLGFVPAGRRLLHIGSSPSARDFFDSVFAEASQ